MAYNSVMMSLPKIEEQKSAHQLRAENDRLIEQGQKMLNATKLLTLFGDTIPTINGSFAYNLMVYPDIDCDVVNPNLDKQMFAQIVESLVNKDFVRKVSTADTVAFEILIKGRPKGYWLGLEIPFEGERWGVDCWFQRPEWLSSNPAPYLDRLSKLSQDQINAVLLIKQWLIGKGLYGKQFYSADVYDAVLDSGVNSVKAFADLNNILA